MKFTPKEMSILACLMASDDYVTTDRLHHALYGTRNAAPSKNAVYVFITRLADKLKKIGAYVAAIPGKGYHITPSSKLLILAEFGRDYFCLQAKKFAQNSNVVKR
jgi:DNA-binding response OmpR family regulator